ncbi:hypothetical protein [Paraburkholderia phymatum]|nr:hypothetical protein [Paraburkholderia phymatum]
MRKVSSDGKRGSAWRNGARKWRAEEGASLHKSLQNANMLDVFYRRPLATPRAPVMKTFARRPFKGSPEMIDAERNEIV